MERVRSPMVLPYNDDTYSIRVTFTVLHNGQEQATILNHVGRINNNNNDFFF